MNVAVIPSGGVGSRFNSPIPKQYVEVLGKPLIAYTLEVFQKSDLVDQIIIPAEKSYFKFLEEIKEKYNLSKITQIIEGGKERQDSVYNGIKASNCTNNDLIIVHDAARPLLSKNILEKGIEKAKSSNSAVIAIKARDTLIEGDKSVTNFIDRSKIYYAQTPQIFSYEIIKKSFDLANKNNFRGTDESMIVKNADFEVNLVDGDFTNFKVTTKEDLELVEKFLKT